MFSFLKKIGMKFLESSLKMSDDDWIKYRAEIYECAKKRQDRLIGNFSEKGFEYIYDMMIQNTEFQIIFFIKNFESIFDKAKFTYFEYSILKSRPNIRASIYTFSGDKDERFIELETKYEQFKYVPLIINDKNTFANNFIISDCFRYWIEEDYTSMKRTSLYNNEPFKACCNFHDYNKVSKLLDYVDHIDNQIKSE
jgi:hypothetical protein